MEINTIRERRKRKLDDAQLSLIEHLKSVKTTNEFPSLKELVIQSIAKNIESWITAEVENENQKYESPFECLSTKDTLAVLNAAIDINYDEKHCLKLFFHKRIKAFDFSLVSLRNRIMAYKYFTQRCKGIKELFIPDQEDISYDLKKAMGFPKMTNTEYSDLVNLCFEYNFVEILSINHKSIKSLKIPGGKMDEHCYELLTKCDQLQKLSLSKPNKLDAKTLTKILSSLPMLSNLSLFGNNIDFELLDPELRFNNILTLDIGFCKITNQGIGVILTIMPNINSLSIHNCFYLDVKCFDIILKLEHLQVLNASISNGSFDLYSNGYFERFLMKQGDKLISIDLSCLDDIDTTMIAKYCSNIETLDLSGCNDFEISWICKSDLEIHENNSLYNHLIPFKKENYSLIEVCHKLHTLHFSDDNCNKEQLQMLFSGNIKALRNLELSLFDDDHENFITKFFGMFHFKYLEKLSIYLLSGTVLPKKEVYTILRKNIYLKELNLRKCSLTVEDIKDIKDVIEQSKSNVKIYFESDILFSNQSMFDLKKIS